MRYHGHGMDRREAAEWAGVEGANLGRIMVWGRFFVLKNKGVPAETKGERTQKENAFECEAKGIARAQQ